MQRQCVCGKNIKMNRQLCFECSELYGSKREEWDKWLVEWMRMYESQLGVDAVIDAHETSFTDMGDDFEEFIWSNV